MSIGNGKKTYSYSTLKSMIKDELIEIIRCLESNLRNAHETNDIQYENCKRLLSEEKIKFLMKFCILVTLSVDYIVEMLRILQGTF